MLTIKLQGILAEKLIPELRSQVGSVQEAIACLSANFPSFTALLHQMSLEGIAFHVKVGYQEIDERQLVCPIAKKVQTITITPIPQGAGTVGKIITGAALLGLGLAGVGFLGFSATAIALTGGAMLLSGVSSLFGRVNKPENDENEGKRSLVFGSPQQTIKEGGRVPIAYGKKVLVGHYVVSARIRSVYKPA